jgi:signal transduction histidine kinase
MPIPDIRWSLRRLGLLWRTTTFRLALVYGLIFAVGTVALLGLVYVQSAGYLTRRVDSILRVEVSALAQTPPARLSEAIGEALALGGGQTSVFAAFTPRGGWIAGNLRALPADLIVDGPPREVAPTPLFHAHARLIARRLPSGLVLVVGRDVNQLRELRAIISSALMLSGVVILVAGLGGGAALSIGPLRRVRHLQAVAQDIAAGDLKRRMPVGAAHDELDMFAVAVNHMVGEVERLMAEVKGASETIAHDLRTPLTRARAQLHRIRQSPTIERDDIVRVTAEIDEVLERFRALMRLSELEARERRAGFQPVDLGALVDQVAELYSPLAEASGVRLIATAQASVEAAADPKLLFEALSNLMDNAIKFSPDGAPVTIAAHADGPRVVVRDEGPGIPEDERSAVLQRFYRGERDRLTPGSGLGLAIVAAIVRLHGFRLTLRDAGPGLEAVIHCRPPGET